MAGHGEQGRSRQGMARQETAGEGRAGQGVEVVAKAGHGGTGVTGQDKTR
jgi:hypothetical protein